MANSIITEKDMRLWAKDVPELNTLVDGVRFSSADIENAMLRAIDRFNILGPPSSNYKIENFPSSYLLMLGTWGLLLRGAAIGEASNQFDYSVDGVQVQDRNKFEMFTTLGDKLWQEYIDTAREMKLIQSINKAYGTKWSEYRYRYF